MTKTNNKDFKTAVQQTILSCFDDYDSMMSEINHYFNEFGYRYGETMCQYGCFDCYYSQCAESMADWFKMSVDDVWEYYHDNSDMLWHWYKHFIKRELECIRLNRQNYIKKEVA